MRQIEFRAMGCKIFAALDSPSGRNTRRLEQLPVWFEAWEQTLSRFRQDSELSLLNQSAGTPVRVSDTLWEVFQVAQRAESTSGGLVTPMILNALVLAGYNQSFEEVPHEQFYSPHKYRTQTSVHSGTTCNVEERTICLSPGLQLDYGGVAKGWAAHQAAQRLKAYGSALVNAGGDIAISSLQDGGQPWSVSVENPFDSESDLETLELGRCGVATSGKDYRRWKLDGVWSHHIIDPRTGQPAETDVLTSTVIAPTVMEAEMAAKVVLISGSQSGLAWLDAHPQMAGLLVLDNGKLLYSQQIEKYLRR